MNYIRWVFCFELQVVLVIFMPETAIKLKAKKNFSEQREQFTGKYEFGPANDNSVEMIRYTFCLDKTVFGKCSQLVIPSPRTGILLFTTPFKIKMFSLSTLVPGPDEVIFKVA